MKTTSFDSKASLIDSRTYANSMRCGLKIIREKLTIYTSAFTNVLIWLRFLTLFPFNFFICDDSNGSCEANFDSKAVAHNMQIQHTTTKKQSDWRESAILMLRDFSLTSWRSFFITSIKVFASNDSNESSEASPLEATLQRTSWSVTKASWEINRFLAS